MIFDKETKYWRGEYLKGNYVEDSGIRRCELDGTAEREVVNAIKMLLWSIIPITILAVFTYLQKNNLALYNHIADVFRSWGICLGTEIHPTICILLYVTILIIFLNVLVNRYIDARLHAYRLANGLYRPDTTCVIKHSYKSDSDICAICGKAGGYHYTREGTSWCSLPTTEQEKEHLTQFTYNSEVMPAQRL